MQGAFRITSNHQQVLTQLAQLRATLSGPFSTTVSRDTAQMVATQAHAYAHVGPDPTHPRGRPHTRDTIRLQPLNQFATRVLADYGAPYEEMRGGDHAFMTRAVAAVEPQALDHFTQLGRQAIARAST